jgi:hypothetical protein
MRALISEFEAADGANQATPARLPAGTDIAPIDEALGRQAEILLARTRTKDVHDAAVVLLASDGDTILTSDVDDLELLAGAGGADVEIMPV